MNITWFERISMIAILINCITLGSYQPCYDAKCETSRCQWLKLFDHVIFLFFLLEMLIKMIAMGVTNAPQAYLADCWNRLDFFIVIAGGLEYVSDFGNVNFTAIRLVRVLRPLRAINRISSMRILVTLLLDTLPMLGNVLLLCFFVFFIFGIIGVQLWSGLLRQRCFIVLPDNFTKPSYVPSYYRLPTSDKEYLCSATKDNGLHRCQDLPPLRTSDLTKICQNLIPSYYQPPPPNQIVPERTFYDHEQVPYDLVPGDEGSPFLKKPLSPLIAQSVYQPAFAPEVNSKPNFKMRLFPMRQKRQNVHAPKNQNLSSERVETNDNSDQFEMAESFQNKLREERRRNENRKAGVCINWNKYYTECKPGDTNPFQGTISFDNVGMAWTTIFLVISLEGWSDIMYLLQDSHSFWVWTYFVLLIVIGSFFMINLCLVVIATQFSATKKREMERMRQERLKYASTNSSSGSTLTVSSEGNNCYKVIIKYIAHLLRHTKRRVVLFIAKYKIRRLKRQQSSNIGRELEQSSSCCNVDENLTLSKDQVTILCANENRIDATIKPGKQQSSNQGRKNTRNRHSQRKKYYMGYDLEEIEVHFVPKFIRTNETLSRYSRKFNNRIQSLVDHCYFQRLILLAILINTISMGIEYHNQPQQLTEIVEISNIVFAILFLIEMILKLIAHGIYAYVFNGFNCFDGCIVILSILELFESSGSGLSVLRTFRLLRILKLVRFMPALRRQLVIMLRTLDNVAVFFALLVLFIFIFAVLGMNLFGCKFCETLPDGTERCDRKNFNSLLWSLVSVFQILTQEDWNVVLFNGMEKTSHWAALYFVLLMTFGNYVLFNLLVAILVEGFSQEDEPKGLLKDGYNNQNKNTQEISRDESNLEKLACVLHRTGTLEESNTPDHENILTPKQMTIKRTSEQSFLHSDHKDPSRYYLVDISNPTYKENDRQPDKCLQNRLKESIHSRGSEISTKPETTDVSYRPKLRHSKKKEFLYNEIDILQSEDSAPKHNSSKYSLPLNEIPEQNSTQKQFAMVSNTYFGFKRAPKRLVYFYDFTDNIEEEIQFLSRSLKTKSYATSVISQTDPYLNSISKSQDKTLSPVEDEECFRSDSFVASKKLYKNYFYFCGNLSVAVPKSFGPFSYLDTFKEDTYSSAERIASKATSPCIEDYDVNLQNYPLVPKSFFASSTRKRLSSEARESMNGLVNKNVSYDRKGFCFKVGPHWCSLPFDLNKESIDLMKFYQSNVKSDEESGRMERKFLEDYGKFDRAACRIVELETYTQILNRFRDTCEFYDSSTRHPAFLEVANQHLSRKFSFRHEAIPQTRASKPSTPDLDILNLSPVYEPFSFLPAAGMKRRTSVEVLEQTVSRNNRSSSGPCLAGLTIRKKSFLPNYSSKTKILPCAHRHSLKDRPTEFQISLLKSIELYGKAIADYNENMKRPKNPVRKQSETLDIPPHNNDLSASKFTGLRGTVIVSSKFKFLNTSSNTEDRFIVPRLSLSRPERTWSVADQKSSSSSRLKSCYIDDINLKPQEQKSTEGMLIDNGCGLKEALSITNLPIVKESKPEFSSKVRHSTSNASIDYKLQRISLTPSIDFDYSQQENSNQIQNLTRVNDRRLSLINWLQNNQINKKSRAPTSNSRSSFFSQTSKSTSIITERCQCIIGFKVKRRRSFSGPFEWYNKESHISNMMCEESTKSRFNKRRFVKVKPQKSNSSDYHSLNSKRVYKLDSRGTPTGLRGVFYVINRNHLALNNKACKINGAPKNTLIIMDFESLNLPPQQPQISNGTVTKDTISSIELETSFFKSTSETNGSNNGIAKKKINVPIARPDLSILETNKKQPRMKQRTFFKFFYWTSWMIKRRHYSLFIFSPTNIIRRFCIHVTNRREFDYFILFFISMNCVTLAMERPNIPPWSQEREFLTIVNFYFTFMFTLEMLLKVIAKNLYYGKDAYFSDNWNIMDGSLVALSLLDLLLSIIADKSPRIFAILRVFRLLRSLRPLRVINRLMGLKLVVQTLLLSLRPIGNIVLICCTFFIIFGILGVQLFKGTFYYCDGPDPLMIMRKVETKQDCLSDTRNRWINRKYNFDNLGQALMALFVLSSKDGWVNIMYTGLDAVGVDMQPKENYNEWRLIYFISFLLLVAFFVLNMFVGVVVENFHRCRKEQEMEEKARRAEKRQRKLDKRRRKLREPPYFSNYGKTRKLLHRWVTGGYFDLMIAAIIGCNVIFMSLEHYQMGENLIYILKISNYAFTVVFIMEAVIKIVALGWKRYIKDRWNQLDVSIVAMSIVGIIFEEMDSFTLPINPTLLRVLRVMRIARVLKLLKMAKGIRALLDTVMQALPQVGNLGLLFFLLFFIFAALGVELFGRLECNDDYPCSGLNDQHAHFQNFGLAFLTLFRVATGDNWNGIMKDTLRDKCDSSSKCLKNCCVSQLIAPLYFVVFVLLAQFVLVNVVVAVLMKHLEESHQEMEVDEEYELDKQLAEELEAKKSALIEAKNRQSIYWI